MLSLEKLLSSLRLCLEGSIFDALGIDPMLKRLLQYKAATKLRTLRNISNQPYLINPYKLTQKQGAEFTFHTLYISQRPLRTNTIHFDHWALKFEGKKNLLTVEFFDDESTTHGVVKMRMFPNTRLTRRVFWYWWEQDDVKESKLKPQFFTQRWKTIWKVWLNCISCECIGRLVMQWLTTNDYAIYSVAKNNCQHFVRDITAVLDISAAKKLSSLFDHKVIASVLPGVTVADGMTEEVRMYEIRDILLKEMRLIGEETARKVRDLQQRKYTIDASADTKSVVNVGLDMENVNACNEFFVLDDKERMTEHLNSITYDSKWSTHFGIVVAYINSPQNMVSEQILEDIQYPHNTALMTQLKGTQDADEFVRILVDLFKDFILDEDSSDNEESEDENKENEWWKNVAPFAELYCDGSCGNTFPRYAYTLKHDLDMNSDAKLLIISSCFNTSYDAPLRKELITLMEKHYFIKLKQNQWIPNNRDNAVIVSEMLNVLKNENHRFECQVNHMKWVHKFDILFSEFIKTNQTFMLDRLCLRGCTHSLSMSQEIEMYSDKTAHCVDTIKQSAEYKTMCSNGYALTNNELKSLHTFIECQDVFCNERMNACKWKQLYANLCSAVKKIHEGLAVDDVDLPETLYCYTESIVMDKQMDILSLNHATYWSTSSVSEGIDNGKYVEFNNINECLFHLDEITCLIEGVCVDWITENYKSKKCMDRWILMPFIVSPALFSVHQKDGNCISIIRLQEST